MSVLRPFAYLALGLGVMVDSASAQQQPVTAHHKVIHPGHPAPHMVHPAIRPLPTRPNPGVFHPANPVFNPGVPAVNNTWTGYNNPMSVAPWASNIGWTMPPMTTAFTPNPFATTAFMPSYYSTSAFSSGLNNPNWGNSGNPFATLASPLTFSSGLNSPYWSGGIQQAQNQAANILYQQMLMQQWYQSMIYFQNPFYSPYYGMPNYGMTSFMPPAGGAGGFGRFLDAGPLGQPGVPQPLNGMAAIGAGFPVGLGR